MSNISTYLKNAGMRQSEFAAQIGISRGYMSELASGDKSPSRVLAVKIERATDGLVSVSSWDHSSLHANASRSRQARPRKPAGSDSSAEAAK